MNEAEWAATDDLHALLAYLGDRFTPSQRRRFACECVMAIRPYLSDERCLAALEAAQLYAAGQIDVDGLHVAYQAADRAFSETCVYGTSTGDHALRAAALAAMPDPVDVSHVCYCCEVTYCFQATQGYTAGRDAEAVARATLRRSHADRLRAYFPDR